MQDGTYPSRNLATLGPSGLRPPFTGIYKKNGYFFFSFNSTGQMSDFIPRITTSQNLMFLINSRHPLFIIHKTFSFSRSYWVNLPSSFNTILPFALLYSKNPRAFEYSTISVHYSIITFPGLLVYCFFYRPQIFENSAAIIDRNKC